METTIKHITTIQTGLFAKPTGKGEVVYLQSKHFDEFGQLTAVLYPDLKADNISEKHLLNTGDVLFAAKGTKNFAAVYESGNPPAVASTSFFVLKQTDENVLPEYLAWFLNHTQTQSLLKGKARGTSIPSITKSVLESLEIEIPPLEKQKLIIRLADLALQESELRVNILSQRKQLIEQQIINAIK
ncbi:MAG: restriction endonuclease subunit S [Chitinophagaceae bacterium]|nr:restriction endonuclease subunit S [Chitinophagaceae bacterium]